MSAIGVATIFPFQFVIPEGFSGQFILNEFNFGSTIKDYWQNILLFVPFGISLAMISDRQQQSNLTILIISFLASAILSTSVELTQFFLPPRISNLTDIICNSLGGTLGAILYGWRSSIVRFIVGIVTANSNKLSLKSLLIAIASYCSIVALAIWILLISVNLSNWDSNFYLAIGNEVTGDRPWNGYINSLYISDRSLTKLQVAQAFQQPDPFFAQLPSTVGFLDFTQKQNYYQDSSKHIPDLLWQNTSTLPQTSPDHRASDSSQNNQVIVDINRQNPGLLVNSKHWLKTEKPAVALNQKLEASSEFALFFVVASKELSQDGPARIITLSNDINTQNMMIGQAKTGLSFRLRTPITGYTPNQPEFVVPDVFNNYGVRQILITFAERKINFYIDNLDNQYTFLFTPYITFYSYLPWNKANWIVNLEDINNSSYKTTFYLIVTIPLVILLVITGCLWLQKSVVN